MKAISCFRTVRYGDGRHRGRAFACRCRNACLEIRPASLPPILSRLDHPLRRAGQRLAAGLPLTIVAVGSSSTSGAGASSPAMSYPSRLAVELKTLFPRSEINVINRGVGGETAKEMLARFDSEVIADKPDIVVWQVGSNSVLRDQPLDPAGALIREGLRTLKAAGADVILMNPQYAPKVIAKHDAELMVDLIGRAAKEAHVDLFQRFAVMRYWRLTEKAFRSRPSCRPMSST